MYITDDLLKASKNNATLVRMILASSVIWTHCYWLTTGLSAKDEISGLVGVPISHLAVNGFFFLSGFLVYPSLLRQGTIFRYFFNRFIRIWPGLMVSVILTALVGLAFTRSSPTAYFGGETFKFIASNMVFLSSHYTLTGVYCGEKLCTINGSLWTITWEVRCYILLAAFAAIGFARPVIMRRLILPLSALSTILLHIPGVLPRLEVILGKGLVYNIVQIDRLWTMFALGIAAFVFRDKLRLSWPVLLLLLALTIGQNFLGVDLLIGSLFIGYFVLCLTFLSTRIANISGHWEDYSFGMYIYAFPVMMAVHSLWQPSTHYPLALVNFLATLPIAALSWHWVEKPALKLKTHRFIAGQRAPAAT